MLFGVVTSNSSDVAGAASLHTLLYCRSTIKVFVVFIHLCVVQILGVEDGPEG